jgi:hypothetical protein
MRKPNRWASISASMKKTAMRLKRRHSSFWRLSEKLVDLAYAESHANTTYREVLSRERTRAKKVFATALRTALFFAASAAGTVG